MRKPTQNMLRILRDIAEGRGTHHNCHGQSEHGGRVCTLLALLQRGLIDMEYEVTEAGKSLVESTKCPDA